MTNADSVRFEPDIGFTSHSETDYEVPVTGPMNLMLIAVNETSYRSEVIQIDYYEEQQADAYDAANQRVLEKNETSETIFVYGPSGELLSELDAAGAPVVEYFYLEGEPIAQIHGAVGGGAASRRWVHNSHLGTPERLTNASRETVWRIRSEPFGEVYDVTANPGETQRSRFPGQLADQATLLNYNWHRYYDPSIGRYISADPIGQRGGLNLYTYALNSPTGVIDPLGLYVSNPTNRTVTVKPENGPMFRLPPKTTVDVSPDGVYDPGTGEWTKFRGKDWLPDNDVEIDPDLGPQCVGGPCRVLPEDKWEPGDSDEKWPTPRDDDIYDPTKEDYWPDSNTDDCP